MGSAAVLIISDQEKLQTRQRHETTAADNGIIKTKAGEKIPKPWSQ